MVADAAGNRCLAPSAPDPVAAEHTVRGCKPEFVSYQDWRKLDEIETSRGSALGRPRVKFTTVDEALGAIRSK